MQDTIDLNEVKKVFPYGQTSFEVCRRFSTVYGCAPTTCCVTACHSLLHRLSQDQQADPCVHQVLSGVHTCRWCREGYAARVVLQLQSWVTKMMTCSLQ